jgi:hypothetical protein
LGRHADINTVLKFGIPAILAAYLGAILLVKFSSSNYEIFSYAISRKKCSVTFLKLLICCLLIIFALIDKFPFAKRLEIGSKWLWLGGIMSGFFGGLSGNQGALRAAFLSKLKLSKEQFIATTAVVSTLVDVTRIPLYNLVSIFNLTSLDIKGLAMITLAAMLGSLVGNIFLKKITNQAIAQWTTIFIVFVALLLGLGVL